jgi:UDP-N-acetylglucosamine/UDP-N-acetylgalactosamine 4-epimerase
MSAAWQAIHMQLRAAPRRWLVTGAAGFIGSHLVSALLDLSQIVTGLDDLSEGDRANLPKYKNFTFIEGDIRDRKTCLRVCKDTDIILHHAAVASVVKSLEDPVLVNGINSGGFLSVFMAAAESGVKRFVYASSSAVYGNGDDTPRREDDILSPASPYAVTKYENEMQALVLGKHYGLETVGLRYFNIYGPGQDPEGAYAAVIPKWLSALEQGKAIEIYGDGKTVRDFCYIDDAVQANILAATMEKAAQQVFNIGSGQATSLNDLFRALQQLAPGNSKPVYRDFRAGDIRISCADITKARKLLGYEPLYDLKAGLSLLMKSHKACANA